jgi:hypothetical protein
LPGDFGAAEFGDFGDFGSVDSGVTAEQKVPVPSWDAVPFDSAVSGGPTPASTSEAKLEELIAALPDLSFMLSPTAPH